MDWTKAVDQTIACGNGLPLPSGWAESRMTRTVGCTGRRGVPGVQAGLIAVLPLTDYSQCNGQAAARQLVRHGHFTVNGRKVDIPSFSVKPGDVVAVRPISRKSAAILHALEEVKGRGVPEWLQFDAEGMAGKIGSIPNRQQINLPVQEQLIVELYSK
jgi:hypothetical protein